MKVELSREELLDICEHLGVGVEDPQYQRISQRSK